MIDNDKLRERYPRLTDVGRAMLTRLLEHPDAPRFNYSTGDRLWPEDLPVLDRFREALLNGRYAAAPGPPPASILSRVAAWRQVVPYFQQQLASFRDLESEWERIPTTSRADLALRPWDFVPVDEPLDRLVIYRTAGTTGHPITVSHHPIAIRLYEPMIEYALIRHSRPPDFGPGAAACFLIGAQIRTYTYAAVLTGWNEAGFAKLNLRQTEWPKEGSQRRYIEAFAPRILTGDPISFGEMMRLDLPATPLALVSTSVAMSPQLKSRLAQKYKAPVIDWYSLVETGPIGYICPRGGAYHVLPPDIHVEALRPDGTVCGRSERGEITVTGGRNPYAPLIRYRTGDWGRMDYSPCECGDPAPRIIDLEGRTPLLIRSADGTPVSTVDLSRILREHPLLLHEFIQRTDGSCELAYRPVPGHHPDPKRMEDDLRRVLGQVPLEIRCDATMGDRVEGKVQAYRSELMLED
jgi:phenylacetate-CoA ligase